VNRYPIVLNEFEVEYKDPDNGNAFSWYGSTVKKYSLKQIQENEKLVHIEISLSKEELKIIIEQFLNRIQTPFAVEY